MLLLLLLLYQGGSGSGDVVDAFRDGEVADARDVAAASFDDQFHLRLLLGLGYDVVDFLESRAFERSSVPLEHLVARAQVSHRVSHAALFHFGDEGPQFAAIRHFTANDLNINVVG